MYLCMNEDIHFCTTQNSLKIYKPKICNMHFPFDVSQSWINGSNLRTKISITKENPNLCIYNHSKHLHMHLYSRTLQAIRTYINVSYNFKTITPLLFMYIYIPDTTITGLTHSNYGRSDPNDQCFLYAFLRAKWVSTGNCRSSNTTAPPQECIIEKSIINRVLQSIMSNSYVLILFIKHLAATIIINSPWDKIWWIWNSPWVYNSFGRFQWRIDAWQENMQKSTFRCLIFFIVFFFSKSYP